MENASKRKYKRLKRHFVLKFRPAAGEGQKKTPDTWTTVLVQDVGAEGALFKCNERLEVGSILDLQIRVPISEEPINCIGKIIRTKKIPDSTIFSIAVVFMTLSKKQEDILNIFIEKLYLKDHDNL